MDMSLALTVFALAGIVAAASLMIVVALPRRDTSAAASLFAGEAQATVLLFDGERLVDATPAGRAMIADGADRAAGAAWTRLLARLEPVFPGLATRIDGLPREGRFALPSREDVRPSLTLRAEYLGGLTRLTLVDAAEEGPALHGDIAGETVMMEEIAGLRDAVLHAPVLIWRENPAGEVLWANAGYLRAAMAGLEPGQELTWPLPGLFPRVVSTDAAGERRVLRIDGFLQWFELSEIALAAETLRYAVPVNKLVQAELSLRDFMQTLAKTFAHLPIGLAIFDAKRVLQLFNPALIDLTGMPAEFLIARPTLAGLLDAMREKAMIPEPKDYRSWRKQLVELEEAATSGLFEDTWTLPSGQTYRVTGRPHPNGALAIIFEDISTEMLRTRRYRADLELGQAVIDAMEDAVVVFGQDGTVAMSNRAAAALVGDFEPGAGEAGLIAVWREMTAPTLLWNDLAEYIGAFGPRDPWDGELRMKDGRLMTCRVSPMPHGSTLVAFRPAGPLAAGDGQAVMVA